MSFWLELVRKGVTAISGILAFLACLYGGLAMIWLVMKAPDAFAVVVAASIIGAAIYFRSSAINYNVQLSHPDTERVIAAVADMASRIKSK